MDKKFIKLDSLLRIPDEKKPNGFKVLKGDDVLDYIQTIAHSTIAKVLIYPECAYEQSKKIYQNLIKAEPPAYADELMLWFMVCIRKSLKSLEEEVSYTVNNASSTYALRRAIAISSLAGYLYIHSLADTAFLDHWMMNVLVGEENKFIRLNLMEIVKIQLMIFVEEKEEGNEGNETLMKMYKAICDENPYDEEDMEEVEERIRYKIFYFLTLIKLSVKF